MGKITIDGDTLRADLAALRSALDAMAARLDAAEAVPTTPAVVVPPLVTPAGARVKLTWGAKVSAMFRDRVWWIADTISTAQKIAFDPNWLMACMAWESGRSFAPDKRNMAGSGAIGLIQFMPTTAAELKTTTTALAAMTAEDQLNFVYKYFANAIRTRGPISSIEDCYMAILLPSAIGKTVSTVLFDKATQATAYRQNAGLDTDNDGHVTKFEAAAKVRAILTEGLAFAA